MSESKELIKALDDISKLNLKSTKNPIDESNKDDFIRQLQEDRYKSLPEMKIALVRPGAIFQKANEFAAGYDLKAFNMTIEDGYIKFMLGVKTQLPKGYYFEVVHRSSNSKFNFILANTKGTIDCDFRGEWQARVKIIPQPDYHLMPNEQYPNVTGLYVQQHIGTQYIQLWKEGEIALQAILHKEPEHRLSFVDELELSETQRGEGGHGSTGNGLVDITQFPH